MRQISADLVRLPSAEEAWLVLENERRVSESAHPHVQEIINACAERFPEMFEEYYRNPVRRLTFGTLLGRLHQNPGINHDAWIALCGELDNIAQDYPDMFAKEEE